MPEATPCVDFVVIDNRQSLREVSGFLQQGIDAIHAKGMSQSTCFGDVYMAIASGAMFCTLMQQDGETVGFYITELCTEHNGDQCLHLAYVYIAPTSLVDLTPYTVASFEEQARKAGCKRIRFKTVRKGWQRRLAKHGFSPSAIELTKPVN